MSANSSLHSHCKHGPSDKKSDPKKKITKITTKPLCDCKDCACNHCPDILGKLSITLSKESFKIGSKAKKCCKVKLCLDNSLKDVSPRLSSILDVIKDRDCSCEVMARAVRSHVHKNMGLTFRREAINLNIPREPKSKETLQSDEPKSTK